MSEIDPHFKCAVVGGGISGIAAAHFLQMRNVDVEIVEQGGALGGRIGSARLGERTIDLGGKNIGRKYMLFRAFAASLGEYGYEPFGINSSRVRHGKIVTLDSSRRWRSTLNFLRDCPKGDVVRFASWAAHVMVNEENRFLGSPFFNALARRLDDAPLALHFGRHFSQAVLRSISVRMNGAEPNEVYAGNFGTNIGMWLDTYDQLRDGMATLVQAFSQRFAPRLSSRVEELIVSDGRVVGLRIVRANGAHEVREYDHVVLATPAATSARLIRDALPDVAAQLDRVRYFPVMVLVAEYKRDIFSSAVRALTFGQDEPLSNAGAYGIDARHIVRYTLSGRTARALLEEGLPADDLLGIAEGILNRHIPVKSHERRAYVAHLFDPGLCAYAPHHARVLDALRNVPRGIGGLHLTGDYVCGASIEACMRAAHETVAGIDTQFRKQHAVWHPSQHSLEGAAP